MAIAAKKRFLGNLVLLCASLLLILILGELVLRLRYVEPARAPSDAILAIQPHLRLDPDFGFTWNANVSPEENIVFEVRDVEFEPLTTDESGFINHPEAIKRRQSGATIDIVGLGDSFIEHAAHPFHEFFNERGLAYYSMAIHRQSPPQYTAILEKKALPLKPKWILYGLFENDFIETGDYTRWQASGLDWFTFHSGTWCGRPLEVSTLARFREKHLRGFTGLYRVILSRIRGDNMTVTGPREAEQTRVRTEILRAQTLAREAGATLLVLLIPGRGTVVEGASPESEAYDTLLAALNEAGVAVLDLREPFLSHEDPASLYYEEDAHWNLHGIRLAAEAIYNYIQNPAETVPN